MIEAHATDRQERTDRRQPIVRLQQPKRARVHGSDVSAACGFILAVTLGLWWQHGGVEALLAGGTGSLRAAGQLPGLLAALSSLAAIILTARPAFLERRYGLDQLLAAHRWFGIATVTLVVAHTVFATLAWSASSGQSVAGGGPTNCGSRS